MCLLQPFGQQRERIFKQLEIAGIVGAFDGSKARNVLISDLDSLDQFLNSEKMEKSEIQEKESEIRTVKESFTIKYLILFSIEVKNFKK